ncbi:MAG: hypothetical protein Q8880_01815 [Bacteroidota bacterium]|nr:hypothetical protein [Bacteroidota bacterium]
MAEFSPCTINFVMNLNPGSVGVNVINGINPNNGSVVDYISRYWHFTANGLTTYLYNTAFNYLPSDVHGNENNLKISQYNTSNGWETYFSQSTVEIITHNLKLTSDLSDLSCSINNSDYTGRHNLPLYFKTIASGNWNDPSIWEVSTDSSFQNPTGCSTSYSPNAFNSEGIFVVNPVTINTNIAIDQTTIFQGAQIIVNSGKVLYVNDGPGTDIKVKGTLDNKGTIYNSGSIYVDNFGRYIHDQNNGTVPLINWNINSYCIIKCSGAAPSGLDQNFGIFEYNNSGNTLNLSENLNVLNKLIINAGTINADAKTINVMDSITGTGNLTYSSGILNIGGNYSNTGIFTCGTGVVNYNSTHVSQGIKGTTYSTLNIYGSNNKYLLGNIVVNASFNLNAGSTLNCYDFSNNDKNVTFNDSVHCSGIFIVNNNTVTYNSTTVNQDVIPVKYYNLIKTGAGKSANLIAPVEVVNNFSINSGTFACGNFNLTLDGNSTNSGTFTIGNNTVIYNGTGNQNIIPVTYYNLRKSNTGTASLTSNAVVQNMLIIDLFSKFSLGNTATSFTVNGSTHINGSLIFGASTVKTVILNDSLSGGPSSIIDMSFGAHNLYLNGYYNYLSTLNTDNNSSTIYYSKAGEQIIFSSPNYINMTISGTGKKILNGPATINKVLNLFNNIYVDIYDLTIGFNGSIVSGSGIFDNLHMIVTDSTGNLVKNGTDSTKYKMVYPVGTTKTGAYYTPFEIKGIVASVSGVVGLAVRVCPYKHPNIPAGRTGLSRYWILDTIGNGMSGITANLYFTFNPSDYTTGIYPGLWNGAHYSQLSNPSNPGPGSNPFYSIGTNILVAEWTQLNFGKNYYSYQSGNWNNSSTWTTDMTGSISIDAAVPGPSDSVIVLNGRTVTLPANISTTGLSLTICKGGTLDMVSHKFQTLNWLTGQGLLRLNSNIFPTIVNNTFCGSMGGTVEYYNTGSFQLPVLSTYCNLILNLDLPGSIAYTMNNIKIFNNFTVKNGTFRICDNNSSPTSDNRIIIDVANDVFVTSTGSITVGTSPTNTTKLPSTFGGTPPYTTCSNLMNAGYETGALVPRYYDIYHKFYCGGNFTNYGTVSFICSSIVLPNFTTLTQNGALTFRFYGPADDSLYCGGPTDFYNLIIDKGVDQTFTLTVNSTAYKNFRLFGQNACGGANGGATGNPELDKALWVKNGTLRLTGNTIIPSLSEGTCGNGPLGGGNNPNSDFYIPSNGCFILDGPNVVVLSTADDYREVNVAYGITATSDAVLGISEGGCSSYSVYGKLQINNGYYSSRESGGFIFWPAYSGTLVINGGTVDAKQCRTVEGSTGYATFIQNGGTLNLRGRYRRDKTTWDITSVNDIINSPIDYTSNVNATCLGSSVGTLNIDQDANVFTMTGGIINIYDLCAASPRKAIEINSLAENNTITGGCINIFVNRQNQTYQVAADAEFPNLNIIGGVDQDYLSQVQLIDIASKTGVTARTNLPLIVLDSLTVTKTILNANNNARNVTIGGNFKINNAGSYLTSGGTNITTLNGGIMHLDQTINTSFNYLVMGRTGKINCDGSGQKVIIAEDLNISSGDTTNDGGKSFNVAGNIVNSGYIGGSGNVNLTSGIVRGLSLTSTGTNIIAPSVIISGGGGNGAVANAIIINGKVVDFIITNQGSGYTSVPTINISGGGATVNATATAIISNKRLTAICITNQGAGYTTPSVTIAAPGGTGINALAIPVLRSGTNVNSGTIFGLIITNPGVGYSSTPSVSFTNGGGATASALITGLASSQISGDGNGIFNNLILNNNNGSSASTQITLNCDIKVKGSFTMSQDRLFDISTNSLYFDTISTLTGSWSANRFIKTAGNPADGGVTKVFNNTSAFIFPVGTGTNYAPATIQLTTSPAKYGSITILPVPVKHPFVTSSTALAYYWKTISSGFTGVALGSINQTYNYGNLMDNTVYIPGRFYPNAWTSINDVSKVVESTNDIQFWGVNYIDGDYTCANSFNSVIVYYSHANGNWNSNTTWSLISNSDPANAPGIPGAANPVIIGDGNYNNHKVTVNAAGAVSGSLTLSKKSVIDVGVTTGHNFGLILPSAYGYGTLRISSSAFTAVFPGGNFSNFLNCGGGTVEYYTTGTTDYTLPVLTGNPNKYANLRISPNSGRYIAMPNIDVTVCGNFIDSGQTATGIIRLNTAASRTLTVKDNIYVLGGNLQFRSTFGASQNIRVDSNIIVNYGAIFDIDNVSGITNTMSIGGNIINNGTFDMNKSSVCNVTFNGKLDAVISGTGATTDFNRLTLDKGINQDYKLRINSSNFSLTGSPPSLILKNGTFRLISNQNITLSTSSSFTIPSTACLSDSGGVMNICTGASDAYDLFLFGSLEVFKGNVVIGTPANNNNNDIEFASAGVPSIDIRNDAILYVNGQIRRNASNTNGALSYRQDGISSCIIAGRNQTKSRGKLEIQNPGSSFYMSGGNLYFVNGNGVNFGDIYILPDNSNVTGGTIYLTSGINRTGTIVSGSAIISGLTSTNDLYYGMSVAGTGIPANAYIIAILSASSVMISSNATFGGTNALSFGYAGSQTYLFDVKTQINNLTITGVTSNTASLSLYVNPLILKGNLTISNSNSSLLCNNHDVSIAGNFTNSGTYTSGNNNTIFWGANLQKATFNTTTGFNNFTVNKTSNILTLSGNNNPVVNNNMYILNGTIDDGGTTINVLGDTIFNNAIHRSSVAGGKMMWGNGFVQKVISGNNSGNFGNIQLNNILGAKIIANTTINGTLTLSNGMLSIGNAKLILNDTSMTPVIGASSSRYIQTSGFASDSGIVKQYKFGQYNFIFPIGVPGKYTPVSINITANRARGTVKLKPINFKHPNTKDVLNKQLNYYWKIDTTGFKNPTTTLIFNYLVSDVTGSEASYNGARFINNDWAVYGGTTWDNPPLNSIRTVDAVKHTITFSGINYLDGEYTAGEYSEFYPNIIFYSRSAVHGGLWNVPASWSNSGYGGPASSLVPTRQAVYIAPGDTIIVPSGSDNLYSFSLLVNGVLDLGSTKDHNFVNVSGTGTLKITADPLGILNIPSGNFSSFGCYSTSPQGTPVTSGGTGGTFEFNNTGSLNINLPNKFSTYFNLSIASTGTGEVDFVNCASSDLYLNGNLNIKKGSFVNNSAGTGNIYLYGNLNLSSGGIFDNKSRQLYLYGDLINNSDINSFKSTSNLNLAGNSIQTIGGSKPTKVVYLNILNGVKNLNDTLYVDNNLLLSNASAQLNDNGNTIYIKGTWTNNANSNAFNSTGTTVFNSLTNQVINGSQSTTFKNLTISGSVKNYSTTPPTAFNVTGNLLLESGGILNIDGNNMNLSGNWTNNSSSYALNSTGFSCVTFSGLNQKVSGTSPTIFNYLTFSSSGNDTLISNITVNKDLTFNLGSVITKHQNLVVKGNWINNVSSSVFKSIISTDTVILNGTTQNIGGSSPTTFNNLYISNGTKTLLQTDIYINKDFIIEAGGIFDYLNKKITHNGDLINNSGATSLCNIGMEGTYILRGSNQIIKGTFPTTFYNLNIDGGGVKTLMKTTTVSNTLTFISGVINTGANEMTVTRKAANAIIGNSSISYINGKLRRSINSLGTTGTGYDFPVGNTAFYELASLTFNNIKGISNILGYYNTGLSGTKPNPNTLIVNGTPIDSLLNGGFWTLTPDIQPSGGTYNITLNEIGFTNPPNDPEKMSVVKRLNGSSSWIFQGIHNNATQILAGGTATAKASSLTSFSDYAIGYNLSDVLAIQLLRFTARPENKTVELNWTTLTETNNDYFTIEKSKDGFSFEKVLITKGAGTSSQMNNYKTFDVSPYYGQSYYRLKQTDYDGTYKYSEIIPVFINIDNSLADLSVYPNPNNGKSFYTYLTGFIKNTTVEMNITDIYGNSLEANSLSINNEGYYLGLIIPDHDLCKGVYFISCEQSGNKVVKKVIVE